MFALDTNTLIYYFKNFGNVSKALLKHSPSELAIPSIVMFELEVGIAKSNSPQKRIAQLNELTSLVKILDFTSKEAKESAKIRAYLESKGTPIGPFDCLIAGTVLANNATLVTHNVKEFNRIDGLKIIDWF
ncbi:MAG: tRNA(fMet)-specific endonuclease VapC [Polaribacter sp.]|jgi:tRNA(fMet)-specific endonuclease VapC